jgi:hypothetical protein
MKPDTKRGSLRKIGGCSHRGVAVKKESGNFPIVLLFFVSMLLSSCDGGGDADGGVSLPLVSNTNFEAVEPFSIVMPIDNQTLFSLIGINGEINITGDAAANSVTITGIKRVLSESAEDAEAHLLELEVKVQDLANEIQVETIQPADTGGRIYIVNYAVTLPRYLKNNVNNLNGVVTLESIDNDVAVLNLNGNITLTSIFGSAAANVLSGKIEGEVTLPLSGEINMKTLTGDINLEIPENTSATLLASVTVGTISVSNLVLQNEESTPTFLSGTLGSGEGTIRLETEQLGNITVSGT